MASVKNSRVGSKQSGFLEQSKHSAKVGGTYGERKQARAQGSLCRPAVARDKFVQKQTQNNWRARPDVSFKPARRLDFGGKDVALTAVERGAGHVAKSHNSHLKILDQILANPQLHTSNSIRKHVRKTLSAKKTG